MEKIAILVDSGCDLSQKLIEALGIRVLPLKIYYADGEYLDGVNIEAPLVYERFPDEIPKTSTPNFAEITAAAESLRDEGYTHILAVSISSGLSSTYQNVCAALSEVENVVSYVLDTKNISIGAGVLAVHAANLIRKGMPFAEICENLESNIENSRIFYYMDTLDYLRAGGRIGKVAGTIGSLLNLKPIITCNRQGVYETVAKIRGQKRGLQKLIDCIVENHDATRETCFAIMHGAAPEVAREVLDQLKTLFPKAHILLEKQINASLAVHTGPGLIGILLFQAN